jgi:transcriptional regulator with XRE-family HTH domain
MISKEKLLQHPNYLMTKYQAEIFRQLKSYMKREKLSQKKVAENLGVSTSYVNQILNGKFNFTLKKLIQLSLLMGKVPAIEFLTFEEYWRLDERKSADRLIIYDAKDEKGFMVRIREYNPAPLQLVTVETDDPVLDYQDSFVYATEN